MKTPESSKNAIAAEVASADANTFTALFPISIALIRESLSFLSFSTNDAFLFPLFAS